MRIYNIDMKLEALKSIEIKAIEVPKKVIVPRFADASKLSDRIFGALCRINPELPCMEDPKFLKNVFQCIEAAGGEVPSKDTDLVLYMKYNKTVREWRKWYEIEKMRTAAYRKAYKDQIKQANEEKKAKYGKVLINGVEENLQSWTIEPEGIFFGRGESPLNGFWKKATEPSEIVVNSNSSNLPKLIVDEQETDFDWNVKWEPNSHFAAQYNIVVGIPDADGNIKTVKATKYKMIQFAANSSVKKEGQSKKYAAASELGKSYDLIIQQVEKDFEKARTNCKFAELSTAIAVYMLFEKGIRIGSPEATVNNTKGLLSLEWGKEVYRQGNKIKFNFYGKDSVKDTSFIETEYADIIEKGWSKYTKLQTDKASIKNYVGNLVPEIKDVFSPKLCRTAVAASVMLKALDAVTAKYKLTKDTPEALKKLAFNEANMEVAKKLNHQRGVNKVAAAKREEANKLKKEGLKEREAKVKELKEKRLQKIESLKAKSNSKEKIAKIKEQIKKADERIAQSKRDLKFREENGDITASTSKGAYIDPSIVADFCTKIDLSLEKIYSKSQMQQFSQFFGS